MDYQKKYKILKAFIEGLDCKNMELKFFTNEVDERNIFQEYSAKQAYFELLEKFWIPDFKTALANIKVDRDFTQIIEAPTARTNESLVSEDFLNIKPFESIDDLCKEVQNNTYLLDFGRNDSEAMFLNEDELTYLEFVTSNQIDSILLENLKLKFFSENNSISLQEFNWLIAKNLYERSIKLSDNYTLRKKYETILLKYLFSLHSPLLGDKIWDNMAKILVPITVNEFIEDQMIEKGLYAIDSTLAASINANGDRLSTTAFFSPLINFLDEYHLYQLQGVDKENIFKLYSFNLYLHNLFPLYKQLDEIQKETLRNFVANLLKLALFKQQLLIGYTVASPKDLPNLNLPKPNVLINSMLATIKKLNFYVNKLDELFDSDKFAHVENYEYSQRSFEKLKEAYIELLDLKGPNSELFISLVAIIAPLLITIVGFSLVIFAFVTPVVFSAALAVCGLSLVYVGSIAAGMGIKDAFFQNSEANKLIEDTTINAEPRYLPEVFS